MTGDVYEPTPAEIQRVCKQIREIGFTSKGKRTQTFPGWSRAVQMLRETGITEDEAKAARTPKVYTLAPVPREMEE